LTILEVTACSLPGNSNGIILMPAATVLAESPPDLARPLPKLFDGSRL
jgi:hypothetical protein